MLITGEWISGATCMFMANELIRNNEDKVHSSIGIC